MSWVLDGFLGFGGGRGWNFYIIFYWGGGVLINTYLGWVFGGLGVNRNGVVVVTEV